MMIEFLIDRLDERSTWRALVALMTLLGISISPEQSNAIIGSGVAIGAMLEALLPDPAGRIHPERGRKSDSKSGGIDSALGSWTSDD